MKYENFSFEITHLDTKSKARCGILSTPHGEIETPNFIFCATKGALKSVTTQTAKDAGAQIILSNTYHLYLQPTADIVALNGGLHKMLNWDGPLLTDSGGFQIFSLGCGSVANEIKGRRNLGKNFNKTFLKITEDGAFFRSYLDGTKHCLTPEISIQTQRKLGADLILTFDECTPFHVEKSYTAQSMRRSHRWELRSFDEFKRTDNHTQALYGIVQGGIYDDLRQESANFVSNTEFFGQAIGGSLGGTKDQMHDIVATTCQYLSTELPTHLLGIGGFSDILNGVSHGIDTFDCVHPTRLARHGGALIHPKFANGKEFLNLNNARFKADLDPIDTTCCCYCCRNFSRSYIHHLFKANEMIGGQLLAIHNIAFMSNLAKEIRKSIKENRFKEIKKQWEV